MEQKKWVFHLVKKYRFDKKIGDTSFNNMEQVHMEYWETDIVKVNVFIFLNEEDEFISR